MSGDHLTRVADFLVGRGLHAVLGPDDGPIAVGGRARGPEAVPARLVLPADLWRAYVDDRTGGGSEGDRAMTEEWLLVYLEQALTKDDGQESNRTSSIELVVERDGGLGVRVEVSALPQARRPRPERDVLEWRAHRP